MKKFAIGSLITAGVMMALGVILAIVGTAVGGKRIIEEGAVNLLNKVSYVVDGSLGSTFCLDNMTVSFNEAYPVVDTGSISDFEIAVGSEITDVEIYMAKGNLEITESDTDQVGIERDGLGRFQYYVEDGTLYVLAATDCGDVSLYLPKEITYEQYKLVVAAGEVTINTPVRAEETIINLGACNAVIDTLETDNLEVESGACNLEIQKGSVSDCNINYSASEISYTGNIAGDVELTGSMGNITLMLNGVSSQFDYDIKSSWGSIDIPGVNMVGWSQKTIDNNALQNMKINASMSNLMVEYYID